jgi:cephalosporin-C deacetylase-like acetyl esterase
VVAYLPYLMEGKIGEPGKSQGGGAASFVTSLNTQGKSGRQPPTFARQESSPAPGRRRGSGYGIS